MRKTRSSPGLPATISGEDTALLNDFFESQGVIRGVVECTRDDVRYLFLNDACAKYHGSTADAMRGKTLRDIGYPPGNIRQWLKIFNDCRRAGHSVKFDFHSHFFPDDAWFHITINYFTNSPSDHPRFAFSAVDITALKHTEQKLIARTRQLAGLASELTLAEHRQRRLLAERLHDHLQQLLFAARMEAESRVAPAKAASDTLLRFLIEAQTEMRAVTGDLSPPIALKKDIASIFRWLAGDMRTHHRLNIAVRIGPVPAIVPEPIAVLIYSAARELLFNVVKHAGVNKAELGLRLDGATLLLEVRDKGCGFVPRTFRADEESNGFGLFSIRERTELHGGTFKLESAPRKGTHAVLSIPLKVSAAIAIHGGAGLPASPRSRIKDAACIHAGTGSKKHAIRIVLADDHRMVRDGLRTLINRQRNMVVVGVADNGRQAIDCTRRHKPAIVLMDVNMPVMDGITATAIIKRRWPAVKIIGLSMYADDGIAEQMIAAGADFYVIKSDPQKRLIRTIRQCAATRIKSAPH